MAAEVSTDRPWADALCPICVKYFTDPVSLECGHNFCRSCITRCWEELHVSITYPRGCEYFLEGRKFEPNREVADFVAATKELVERMKEEAKGWANCTQHWKPLNLFCEDDQAAVCSECKKSEAHRNHSVVGMDFTHQTYAYMDIPLKMSNELMIYSDSSVEVTQEWLKRMEAERKKTLATFKDLRQLLDEQERLRLTNLVELEKEIMRKMNKYKKKVSDQIPLLVGLHECMGDMYDNDREFLKVFGGALYSFYDRQPENPVLLPTDVKDKIQKFCDRKLFLEEIRKEFSDEMAALLKGRGKKRARTGVAVEDRGTREDVTLDQDTAHHQLILSADRKTVYYDLHMYFLPRELKSYLSPCVLGRQAFASGRHWWEVKVKGNGSNWAVGVARESLDRRCADILNVVGIWVVGKHSRWSACHRRLLAFSHPKATELLLTRKPEKIRVCLDYPGGQVAFLNAETDESIFVFRSCSFLGEKVRPLFWQSGSSVFVCC